MAAANELKSDGPHIVTRDGFAVYSISESPFDEAEWDRLRLLTIDEPDGFELVTSGDTKEPASVLVKRVLVDGSPPSVPHPDFAAAVLALIGTPERLAFFERAVGRSGLMIRRAQAHILPVGGYIGRHRDSESSRHYLAAVVLLLKPAEVGGHFVVHVGDGQRSHILRDFAMLITDAELPHEVTPVEAGERCTLAFWLADTDNA
jgi:hypothetical protein